MDFKRDWWRILLGVLTVWLLFFMDLNGRSFVNHLWRIANTPETYELGEAIGEKFATFFRGVSRRIEYVYKDYDADDFHHRHATHR
jgi:hypothetical protein